MRPLLRIGLCAVLFLDSAGISAAPRAVKKVSEASADRPVAFSKESLAAIAAIEAQVAALCPGSWTEDPCQSAGYFVKELKESCAEWTGNCQTLGGLFTDALGVAKEVAACVVSECGSGALYDLAREQRLLFGRIDARPQGGKPESIWVWSFANEVNTTLAGVVGKAVDKDLESIGAGVATLKTRTEALEKSASSTAAPDPGRIQALAAEGQVLYERFQALSRGIDHAMSAEKVDKPSAFKERRRSANKIARDLAGLRDRLILLQTRARQPTAERLDLSKVYDPSVDPPDAKEGPKQKTEIPKLKLGDIGKGFGGEGGVDDTLPAGGWTGTVGRDPATGKSLASGRHPLVNALPKKTLLDVPGGVTMLPKLGTRLAPPPIEENGPSGFLDTVRRLTGSQGARKQVDAMRRLGMTQTIGSPGDYASLVHAQDGGSCAVVSQQQVLTAYGLLPAKDPADVERRLKEEAAKKGYFDGGTAPQYSGSLLVDYGLLIAKRTDAKLAELDSVVRQGKLSIVSVDARQLWGMESHSRPLGHAIVVTGAEVDKRTGKVLGYYYNDSGSDPPKGGGFITVDKFRESFDSRGGQFIEIK